MADPIEEREAAWGGRMIEVRVRFWTDNILPGKGPIIEHESALQRT